MDCFPEDFYHVESASFLSDEKLETLMTLYQPILKTDAISLYLTLYAQRGKTSIAYSHDALAKIMDMPLQRIEKALLVLQEYKLLECFLKKEQSKNAYAYVLKSPLPQEEFIKLSAYMKNFQDALGVETAKKILTTTAYGQQLNLNGYQNVTVIANHFDQQPELDHEIYIPKIRPVQNYLNSEEIDFDYEAFFAKTSKLVFPIELRTEENLALIGRLATVNGLSPDTMRLLVKDCVSLSKMELNQELLKQKCLQKEPDVTTATDLYALPPKSFLQSKQHGRKVSSMDASILTSLQQENHFSNEVINIMIEYILEISDNRLVKKFVDMVAGEWARDNVVTREDALKEVEKSKQKNQKYQSRGVEKKVSKLPKYYEKNKAVPKQETTSEQSEEILRKQIEEMQKAMKGE